MFNKTYEYNSFNKILVAFARSSCIQAYPCGRRRAIADKNGNGSLNSDECYIPFDPEARLNTEENNRKHSSQNGFTQTFLNTWDENNSQLSMSLGGYSFKLDLKGAGFDLTSPKSFSSKLASTLNTSSTKIYANIVVDDTKLFAGHGKFYFTGVLRNQDDKEASTSLDVLVDSSLSAADTNNYYFSALSFTDQPLANPDCISKNQGLILSSSNDGTRSVATVYLDETEKSKRVIYSLCILEKIDGDWQIHQPAFLPNIKHGTTPDSVVIPGVFDATTVKQNGSPVSVLTIGTNNDGVAQLQFSYDPVN